MPPKLFGFTHIGEILKIGQNGKYSMIEAHFAQNILKELKIYEAKSK